MFTGIVAAMGKLKKIKNKNGKIYFDIEVKNFLKDVKICDSIACDGVCLTVVKKTKDNFSVELMPETLRLTKFKDSRPGEPINLEKALKMGGRIDGHFVAGHADGVGVIGKIAREGKYTDLVIKAPKKILKYLAYKGSVAVNGVSLTISGARVAKNEFRVSLITRTMEMTNLSQLIKGDKVNLEADMLARYLEKLLKG